MEILQNIHFHNMYLTKEEIETIMELCYFYMFSKDKKTEKGHKIRRCLIKPIFRECLRRKNDNLQQRMDFEGI